MFFEKKDHDKQTTAHEILQEFENAKNFASDYYEAMSIEEIFYEIADREEFMYESDLLQRETRQFLEPYAYEALMNGYCEYDRNNFSVVSLLEMGNKYRVEDDIRRNYNTILFNRAISITQETAFFHEIFDEMPEEGIKKFISGIESIIENTDALQESFADFDEKIRKLIREEITEEEISA